MLEHRDNVGKRFVKRLHVGIRGLNERRMHSVQQSMSRLVRHYVLREARKYCAARKMVRGIVIGGGVVTEKQRYFLWTVVGVRFPQRVRINDEPLDVIGIIVLVLVWRWGSVPPQCLAPEGALEMTNRKTGHGVGRLLMKLGNALRWCITFLSQESPVFQIDWLIQTLAGGIVVDDLEICADRAGLQGLPRHLENYGTDGRSLQMAAQARIERVTSNTSEDRFRIISCHVDSNPTSSRAQPRCTTITRAQPGGRIRGGSYFAENG